MCPQSLCWKLQVFHGWVFKFSLRWFNYDNLCINYWKLKSQQDKSCSRNKKLEFIREWGRRCAVQQLYCRYNKIGLINVFYSSFLIHAKFEFRECRLKMSNRVDYVSFGLCQPHIKISKYFSIWQSKGLKKHNMCILK